MEDITAPPGVFDIIPFDEAEPWRSSHLWIYVEDVFRKTAQEFGYQEIRTPLFERTELFQRGVGETSDIVSKEMYTFEDRGGRSMSLRPEGTAPLIRAFVENRLSQKTAINKFYYIGPMFRYDRPQAGRYRQHHQFGAEAIGSDSPEQDVELIDLLYTIYNRLGLKSLKVYLNSIGDVDCRIAYRNALQNFLRPHFDKLSKDSQARFEANPLRILDSKDPQDKALTKNAPSILEFLNEESKAHFEKVKSLLTLLNIPYEINTSLVRGLDYYNRTVFEVVAGELGAQNSIGGGGRYDGLVKMLGGPDLPATGFATGIERTLQTMLKQKAYLPEPFKPTVMLIPMGEPAEKVCFVLLHELRHYGIASQMDFSGRKLNKMMQYANSIGAKFVAVIGDEEIKTGEVDLKDMATGTKSRLPLHSLGSVLRLEQKSKEYMNVLIEIEKPFNNKEQVKFFADRINQSVSNTKEMLEKMHANLAEVRLLLKNDKK